jgi:hypothetical protein
MTSQQSFDLGSSAPVDRIEVGDDLASAHDREAFAPVLDGIEEVGEVSSCVGGTDLRHLIRLSDYLGERSETWRGVVAGRSTAERDRKTPV